MEYILLKDLSEEFGLDRSSLLRYVKKNDIETFMVRPPESLGQQTVAVTPEIADALRQLRQDEGYMGGKIQINNEGYFYIVQIIPEFAVGRIKLGHTQNVENRLRDHRTIAPTAQVVKFWPCRKTWEITARDSITRLNCKHIANEVYDCEDLEALILSGDAFFELMPKRDNG